VTLTGSVRYQQQDNVPFVRALDLDGVLKGRELAVSAADLNAVVRNVRGEFKLTNGNLDVHGVEADFLGGHVTASATMQNVDGNSAAKLHASVNAISLSAGNAALRTAPLDAMPIDGQISGTADAAWTGSIKNIQARSDITLNAALAGSRAGSTRVPVDGEAHVSYDGRTATATLANTSLHTPQTRVEINGTAGQKLNLKLQARTADLTEVDALIAAFQGFGQERSTSSFLSALRKSRWHC